MKTQPLYLIDSYKTSMEAQILEVVSEGAGKQRLILDQSVFYPMGGGQPTDQGQISSANWKADVYQVMMKNGQIWHYVKSSTQPKVGDTVHGQINWERRYKNMKVHSAGHVVDFSLFVLGLTPKTLLPIKGDHGKKPYIMYAGIIPDDHTQKVQETVNELISKDLEFDWVFLTHDELEKKAIYLQPGLPANKPLRALTLETIGTVADGGTQVKRTSELGEVTITSITSDDQNTTIQYTVA